MAGFDAERYLRLTGPRRNPAFAAAAAALVAVNAITIADAQAFFAKRARYPRFKSRNGRQCAAYTRSGFRWRDGRLFLAKMDAPLAFTWSWPGIDPLRSTRRR